MAYAVINQPLRDVSIGTSAVTLCGLFRQYVATGSIKYMAHQLIDLALVMSQVADRVVYRILLVPPDVFLCTEFRKPNTYLEMPKIRVCLNSNLLA